MSYQKEREALTNQERAAQVLAEASAKAAKYAQDAETEAAILRLLPASVKPKQVFAGYRLYGADAHIVLGDRYSSYQPKHPPLSWSELCDVLRIMGPIPADIRRDGCCSICPADYPGDKNGRYGPDGTDVKPIHGLRFRWDDGGGTPACEAQWWTDLSDKHGTRRLDVTAVLAWKDWPGRIQVEYRREKRTEKPLEILRKDVRRADWFWSEHMLYGGGGDLDPGDAVFYFPRDYYSHDGDLLADSLAAIHPDFKE